MQLYLAILNYVDKNESSRIRSRFLKKFIYKLDDSLAEYNKFIFEKTIINVKNPKNISGGRSNNNTKKNNNVGYSGEKSTEISHESGNNSSELSYGRVAGLSETIRSTKIKKKIYNI